MLFFIIAFIVFLLILAFILLVYENVFPVKTKYNIKCIGTSGKMKIVHLTDLQNTKYPSFYDKIARETEKSNPDYIVFTGDIIDRRKYNIKNAEQFIEKIEHIAPIYFVTGNHEAWCGKDEQVLNMLKKHGVICLRNESTALEKDGIIINLIGIDDVGYITREAMTNEQKNMLVHQLESLKKGENNLLLTHRPERLNEYAKAGIWLVLCGHAHGGQFRLPLIGALYAPHQGLFPKLVCNMHEKNGTKEIISRGLGSGFLQFRTFNRPEIVEVNIFAED